MKTSPATVLGFLVISVLFFGCRNNDEIAAGLVGDTKISRTESAPFYMEQNSPNPFNPSTSIWFYIQHSMHIKLTVYSEDWQPVEVLFDGNVEPLMHNAVFDGRNCASGIYYYVMEGEGYKQIRTMRLVK